MTTDTFYKKVGRRYIPARYYDDVVMDALPIGSTLITVEKNGQSRRCNIDPAVAPMLAAGIMAEDAVSTAILKASEARPKTRPVTQEQSDAWDKCKETWGNDRFYVEFPAAGQIARAATDALTKEVEKMMVNEAVRNAYEQFLLVYHLSRKYDR